MNILVKGVNYEYDNLQQKKTIEDLMQMKMAPRYLLIMNRFRSGAGDMKELKNEIDEYIKLKKKYKDVFTKNKDVSKKIDEYISNLKKIKDRPTAKHTLDEFRVKPFSIGTTEDVEEEPFESIRLYKKFLKNDKEAYEQLKKKAEKGGKEYDALRSYISNEYGFKSSHPLYVKKAKATERAKIFNEHLIRVAALRGLDKTASKEERKKAAAIYRKYIEDKDPKGDVFISPDFLGKYIKDGKIKTNLKVKEYRKLASIINARRQIFGDPKIKFKDGINKAKLTELKESLKDITIDKYKNLFLTYPSIGKSELELEKEKRIEALKEPITEEEIKSARDIELTGSTIDEYISKEFKEKDDRVKVDRLMQNKKGEISYDMPKIKKATNKEEIIKNILEIIGDVAQKNLMVRNIEAIKNLEKFRIGVPAQRKKVLMDSIGEVKYSPKDLERSIKDINDNMKLFSRIQKIIYGEERKLDIESINKDIQAIQYLDKNKSDKISALIDVFNRRAIPEYVKQMNEYFSKTVNARADVRVLPPSVEIKPVAEKKIDDLERHTEINKKLKELEASREGKTPEQLSAIDAEEKILKEQLKSVSHGANKILKQKAERGSQIKAASKRVGQLRPHLRNPTETAVQNEIGKTPEQQIKDFKNWYIFDIPKDYTGVGSSYNNPLVKQNEMLESFRNEGTIYKDYNTHYAVVSGIFDDPKFYVEHAVLRKDAVDREFREIRYMTEEEEFLQKFNKNDNGFFTQDITLKEKNKWQPIYQTPGNSINGTLYPFEQPVNPSIYMSDFRKDRLKVIEP